MSRGFRDRALLGADGETADDARRRLPNTSLAFAQATDCTCGRCRVRQLNYDLKRLQDAHPAGGFVTRRDRSYALAQAANALHEMGLRRLRATGLPRKHVDALVREWSRQELSVGTMKKRMAALLPVGGTCRSARRRGFQRGPRDRQPKVHHERGQ